MNKQDTGSGIQDSGMDDGRVRLNPESRILDPDEERRLRWRCRRGMLELDIVLSRFVEQRYPQLDDDQRAAFDELLDLPDTDLWDLVSGKREVQRERLRTVLGWLQTI